MLNSFVYMMWGIQWGSLVCFACECSVVPTIFIEEIFYVKLAFVPRSKISWQYMCGFISGLSVLFHRSMGLSFANTTLNYSSFISHLEIRHCESSSFVFVFFFKPVSTILVPLLYHINFRVSLTTSNKIFLNFGWGHMESIHQFAENWHCLIYYYITNSLKIKQSTSSSIYCLTDSVDQVSQFSWVHMWWWF